MYKIHEHVIFTIFLSSIWKSLLSLWGISLSYYHRKDSIKSFLGSHQNKMKGDCKDGWTVIWHIPFSWDKAAPATISSVMLSHQYNMKTRAVVLFWIYIHISGQNKPLPVSFQRVIDNLVCHSSSLLTPTSLLLLSYPVLLWPSQGSNFPYTPLHIKSFHEHDRFLCSLAQIPATETVCLGLPFSTSSPFPLPEE